MIVRRLRLALLALSLGSVALAPLSAGMQAATVVQPSGRWTAHRAGGAETPQMGWSSWNAFKTEIDEEKVAGSAEALVKTGLAKRGYVYVNIDDGWWLKRRQSDGRLEVRTSIFPSARVPGQADTSFRPFVDRLHAMGLKAGIYTDIGRNACSQAFDLDSPNLPEGNVKEREVGLEGHVDQDIRLFFKEWGFDYIKVDACGVADYAPGSSLLRRADYAPHEPLIVRKEPTRDRAGEVRALYSEVADALQRHNPDNDYILSICTWGRGDVRTWGNQVGNSWRTSPDISPRWGAMLRSYDSVVTRPLYARPGSWNDPDMLFIGKGDFDADHLVEARSHFSLWAMLNAPLLIGYDLRSAPKALLDIWDNSDVIGLNQDKLGNQAVRVRQSGDVDILVKSLRGRKAVALFNRSDRAQTIELTSSDLKFGDSAIQLRDLWSKKRSVLRGTLQLQLKPRETLLFEADGSSSLKRGTYLSEMPARVHVAVEGVGFPDPTPEASAPAPTKVQLGTYARSGGAHADASAVGTPMSTAGKSLRSGLGTFAGSRLEVLSAREFRGFSATVGIDDQSVGRTGSVKFLVFGDGRLLAQSKALSAGEAAVELQAEVQGVRVLELIAQPQTDLTLPLAVNWGDARLLK